MKNKVLKTLFFVSLISLCSCGGVRGSGASSSSGSEFVLGKMLNF